VGIEILVREATPEGRLYPRYSEESQMLILASPVSRDWPLGIDVDGRVVFDIDANRVVANVDIHIPKHRWSPGRLPPWPKKSEAGDLAFSEEAIAKKSFSFPIRMVCNEERSSVLLYLDDQDPDRVIQLSDDCGALVRGNLLIGLLARSF